jgi:hypothetical protein
MQVENTSLGPLLAVSPLRAIPYVFQAIGAARGMDHSLSSGFGAQSLTLQGARDSLGQGSWAALGL